MQRTEPLDRSPPTLENSKLATRTDVISPPLRLQVKQISTSGQNKRIVLPRQEANARKQTARQNESKDERGEARHLHQTYTNADKQAEDRKPQNKKNFETTGGMNRTIAKTWRRRLLQERTGTRRKGLMRPSALQRITAAENDHTRKGDRLHFSCTQVATKRSA